MEGEVAVRFVGRLSVLIALLCASVFLLAGVSFAGRDPEYPPAPTTVGQEVSAGGLARTGAPTSTIPTVGVALGSIALGTGLVLVARRRQPRPDRLG